MKALSALEAEQLPASALLIDGLAGEEKELANSVERLDKASTAYGMKISAEKTKLMSNNTVGVNTEMKVIGQKLETVTGFKYLGSVITGEGSKSEILSRIAQTTAALTSLKPVWIKKNISLSSKIRLMRSLVKSIFLYACESWTLTAELQSYGNKVLLQDAMHLLQGPCHQGGSPCQDPAGNRTTRRPPDHRKETQTVGYRHVPRSSGLAKTILQGTVKGERRQGKQRKRWEDNIREWAGLGFAKS